MGEFLGQDGAIGAPRKSEGHQCPHTSGHCQDEHQDRDRSCAWSRDRYHVSSPSRWM